MFVLLRNPVSSWFMTSIRRSDQVTWEVCCMRVVHLGLLTTFTSMSGGRASSVTCMMLSCIVLPCRLHEDLSYRTWTASVKAYTVASDRQTCSCRVWESFWILPRMTQQIHRRPSRIRSTLMMISQKMCVIAPTTCVCLIMSIYHPPARLSCVPYEAT